MDLYLDKDAFAKASSELKAKCEELEALRINIENSFSQLHKEWDSNAGAEFFKRFEEELIKNLKEYSLVFEYMSKNLATASEKYEEVFRAADAFAKTKL